MNEQETAWAAEIIVAVEKAPRERRVDALGMAIRAMLDLGLLDREGEPLAALASRLARSGR